VFVVCFCCYGLTLWFADLADVAELLLEPKV